MNLQKETARPVKPPMSKFLSYIHNLRGIAIFFVVGVHARGNAGDWESHPVTHDVLATIFDAQEGIGTVMFLFIAGFLFQHIQKHRFNFQKYLKQKFQVIILPYILISIPIITFRILTDFQPLSLTEEFIHKPFVYQFFHYLITGTHMAPFWFISTIIIFYFTTPIFHAIDRPFFYKYIFPVLFIVGLFTYRSHHNGNPFYLYLHYVPVYLAGMCASVYKDRIFSMDLRYFWILISAYIGITIFEYHDYFAAARDMTFEQLLSEGSIVFNWYILRSVILCFAMSMLLYYFQFVKMPVLHLLGEYSFGIFFVHFIVLVVGRRLLEMVFFPVDFSLLTYSIFFLIILGLSALTVFVIKRVAGSYSRYLIGN
jgi:peptidoglycan/LPS O-acetylase OafA/YrhL